MPNAIQGHGADFRVRWDDGESYVAGAGIIRESACWRLCRARHNRHTFGSRSAMAGVDLATLTELMGHSNISIPMR